MTITISKTKLAVAIVAVAILIPSSAMAFHVFDDVPDDKFYADPVEWAFDNGITTGKTVTTFAPDDNVTRGESVTFLKRYNDNVVEPAVAEVQSDADDNAAAIDALPEILWATVSPAGESPAIVRGSGAVSVTKVFDGYFSVTFDRDVSDCTWVATYGEPDSAGVDDKIATVRGGPTAQEARVVIFDSDGSQADGDGFHLMVVCEPEGEPVLLSLSTPEADTTSVDPNIDAE